MFFLKRSFKRWVWRHMAITLCVAINFIVLIIFNGGIALELN